MEVQSPSSAAFETTVAAPREDKPRKRQYRLTPEGRLSERALAGRRANLAKARQAAKDSGYRRTERRLTASRANLAKAIEARKSPKGLAAARLNALKHGLFAVKTLEETLERLGEDRREFDEHLRFFDRVFVPVGVEEREIVRHLAETVWRRLRLCTAMARWEKDLLGQVFSQAEGANKLTPEATLRRAEALTLVLNQFEPFFRESRKAESQVERWLRRLLLKRSAGKIRFKGFCPRRDPEMREIARQSEGERMIDRMMDMSAEGWAALSEEATLRTAGGT